MDDSCGCQQGYNRRNRRNTCDECEQNYARTRVNDDNRSSADCQCERCADDREVACCEQNTYIRDMDDCGCEGSYNRTGNNGCDECGSACTHSRNRSRRSNDCDNGCNQCESAYNRNRSCGCNGSNASACDRQSGSGKSRKNQRVGMINVEMQEIDQIFSSESALRAGTLFPELHKPLNGYCPYEGNCGTCAQATAFAAWELRLYLNTHPNDKEALALFRKLCKEAEDTNYATTFLTDDGCTSGWNWVKNPWPWEYSCQCGE